MKTKTKISGQTLAHAFILISLLYYWVASSITNPIAIALLLVFGLHVRYAKQGYKLIFPTVFIALNLFMVLALLSEFNEFPAMNEDSIALLSVGSLYLTLNLISGYVMIRTTIQNNTVLAH